MDPTSHSNNLICISEVETAEEFQSLAEAKLADGWFLHSWQPRNTAWKEADFGEVICGYTAIWFRPQLGRCEQ